MEQAEKVLVNKPIYLDSFVSDKSDNGSMDAFSRSPLSKQSKNIVCERIGGKWHWTGYSSLTSSFPVSSPSWHLSPAYPLCQRTPEDQYTHSSLSLSLLSHSSLTWLCTDSLFSIDCFVFQRCFGTLFSWSFIARYTRRHEYLIDSPVLFLYVPLVFALLFIDYIRWL